MSAFPEPLPESPDTGHCYDPPEQHDDTPVEPFDARYEEHELCLCEVNADG
jgi:hypothetical protein